MLADPRRALWPCATVPVRGAEGAISRGVRGSSAGVRERRLRPNAVSASSGSRTRIPWDASETGAGSHSRKDHRLEEVARSCGEALRIEHDRYDGPGMGASMRLITPRTHCEGQKPWEVLSPIRRWSIVSISGTHSDVVHHRAPGRRSRDPVERPPETRQALAAVPGGRRSGSVLKSPTLLARRTRSWTFPVTLERSRGFERG